MSKQGDRDNHANQLNPNHDAFWQDLHPAVRTRAEFSQRAGEVAHDLMVLLRSELRQ